MNTHEKHLPADERKAVIVETVIELAAEQNPHGITTAAIANRMGLTQGALFRHFPNKAAILEAVMTWTAKQLLAKLDNSQLGITSPRDGLRAMFMAHAQFVTEHPGVPRLLFGELQQAGNTAAKEVVQSLLKHYKERLHRLIESGKSSGELDMGLNTEAAAILFIGTIQGLIMQSLLAENVSLICRDASKVFSIYHRGIQRAQ